MYVSYAKEMVLKSYKNIVVLWSYLTIDRTLTLLQISHNNIGGEISIEGVKFR